MRTLQGYNHIINYWVNPETLSVKKSGSYKSWSNIETVIPLELFIAAYAAYKNAIVRFDKNDIDKNYVIIGRGEAGISVDFVHHFSELDPAVMGGHSIDYWVSDKDYKVLSFNYDK